MRRRFGEAERRRGAIRGLLVALALVLGLGLFAAMPVTVRAQEQCITGSSYDYGDPYDFSGIDASDISSLVGIVYFDTPDYWGVSDNYAMSLSIISSDFTMFWFTPHPEGWPNLETDTYHQYPRYYDDQESSYSFSANGPFTYRVCTEFSSVPTATATAEPHPATATAAPTAITEPPTATTEPPTATTEPPTATSTAEPTATSTAEPADPLPTTTLLIVPTVASLSFEDLLQEQTSGLEWVSGRETGVAILAVLFIASAFAMVLPRRR